MSLSGNSIKPFQWKAWSSFLLWIVFTAFLVACGEGNSKNNNSYSAPQKATNILPNTVKLVSISSITPSSLLVEWLPTTDDITPHDKLIYAVYVSTQADFQPNVSSLKISLIGEVSANINGLQANTTYYVIVTATDESGGVSWSRVLEGKTAQITVKRTSAIVHTASAAQMHQIAARGVTELSPSQSQSVSPGDFLVNSEDGGHLRKVSKTTAAKAASGQSIMEVKTEPATLNEIFSGLSFSTTIRLEDISNVSIPRQTSVPYGVAARNSSAGQREVTWKSGLTLADSAPLSAAKSASVNGVTQTATGQYIDISSPAFAAVTPNVNFSKELARIIAARNNGVKKTMLCNTMMTFEHPTNSTLNSLPKPTPKFTFSKDKKTVTLNLSWKPSAAYIDPQGKPYIATITAFADVEGGKCTGEAPGESIDVKIPVYVTQGTPDVSKKTQVLKFSNEVGSVVVTDEVIHEEKPSFMVSATIANGNLQSAQMLAKATMSFGNRLTIEASQKGELDKEAILLPEQRFTRIFMAGQVPVLVSGKFKIKAEVKGEVSGKVNLEQLQQLDFNTEFGLEYVNKTWQVINKFTPKYTFNITGEAAAKAEITVKLIPDLQISFYDAATGRMLVEPYMFGRADVHGQFKYLYDTGQPVPLKDLDYWFNSLEAGIGTDMHLYAGLSIFGWNIASFPANVSINDVDNFHKVEVMKETPIYALPTLEVSQQAAAGVLDSRTIRIHGKAQKYTVNLLGINFDLNPFVTWVDARIISSAKGANIKQVSSKLTQPEVDYDFSYTTPGEYEIRLGGYSKVGWFVRQIATMTLDLADYDNDGMVDQWEKQYGLSDPSTDADRDGANNLQEFKNGTSPLKVDTDSDGFSDGEEILAKTNPLDKQSYPSVGVPTNLKAMAGDGKVDLSWSMAKGAKSYKVCRAQKSIPDVTDCSKVTGVTVSNATTTTLAVTGLTNDTTYYFRVMGINGIKSSVPSAEAIATPQSPLMPKSGIKVSVGAVATCAIVNGGVQCWGGGILGFPNEKIATAVQVIPEGSGITDITIASTHTCIVIKGGVQCWGTNGFGVLGNGTDKLSLFTPVQAIPAGSGVTAIDAGEYHVCAVVNGGVQCWGLGFYGELGNGLSGWIEGKTERAYYSNRPVQAIPSGSGVTAVAIGEIHTCAVVKGGVQCWGAGDVGQLGNGTSGCTDSNCSDIYYSTRPVQTIPFGSGVTSISAGSGHTCVVINGRAQCWGDGRYGQLGNGISSAQNCFGFECYYSDIPVNTELSNGHVTSISAGNTYTCAVVNGGLNCWGFNRLGQLGNGTTLDSSTPVQTIPCGSGVTGVSSANSIMSFHTCASLGNKVKCWGNNGYGQLGNGTFKNSSVPIPACIWLDGVMKCGD